MKASLTQKKKYQNTGKKIAVFLLFFILISSALLAPLQPAKAQMAVTDIPKLIWDKVTEVTKKLWQKGGSLAFQQTLRTALNKIAYDSANWIGSGGEGQKPLFVTQDWGAYMKQVGDEAAGTFLENFAANMASSNSPEQCDRELETCLDTCKKRNSGSEAGGLGDCNDKCRTKSYTCSVKAETGGTGLTFNFCQPSSLEAKVKIGLGLSQVNQPQAPACTATKMIQNWGDAAQKYSDFKDPQFLEKIADVFDPTSSELGIWWSASTDLTTKKIEGEEVSKTTLLAKGGWLDPRTIAGESRSLPNQAELQSEQTYSQYTSNFGKYTGDAFVDAAQLFLNQLSLTAFNKLMQNIGSKNSDSVAVSSGTEQDPNYGSGDTALKDITSKLIQPNFGAGSVYDILSELAICPDKAHPGPTNCVIDNKLMQGITENKTVAEAIKAGYLHGDWRFTLDNQINAYENSYSYRNISILKAHRILPASWELVFEKMKSFQSLATTPNSIYKAKEATLSDLVSCFDPYDNEDKFSQKFDATDQAWCTGLVDPNWVLKAPLNYCKKEGFSAQIINRNVVPSQKANGDNPYVPSEINIIRADSYCADNQTCIKETKNNGCVAYGYCNEEKRTWSFDGDSCEPVNNTCQAFINPSSGQKIAYLENTLDYGVCGPENAGCKRYSYVGAYDVLKGMVVWNTSGDVYLNKSVNDCSVKDEGCSEFIRIKPAWGANLVMNPDFINDSIGASSTSSFLNDWPITTSKATIVDSTNEPGASVGRALKLEGTLAVSVYSDYDNSLLPKNLELVSGQAYTLSADIWVASGSGSRLSIGSPTSANVYENNTVGGWKHVSLTRKAGDDFSQPSFTITAYGSSSVIAYIKNIKFEMSNGDTGYSAYGYNTNGSSKFYQKLLPQYLENACYSEDSSGALNYRLKDNAPTKCLNYVRKCSQAEVGCDLYTSSKNNFSIPAKIDSLDYCPGECVGYDVYIARETYFNSAQADNLIPKTAKECSAESVGCNEFTNLDSLAAGGENREYYSALKHCVKPSQATCGSFYAWEGTGSGYQLRLYSLQKNTDGTPAVVADDTDLCNEIIFNSPINSPLYNPDCQQVYTSTGQTYYHLNSNLITCSDSCRTYRVTEKNYDRRLIQSECLGSTKHWDANEGACISCINGGVWNSIHQACVYQGIPGEGKTCSASENGCREYNGNEGNNVRLAASYDFETPAGTWTSNCKSGISVSSISSNKNGHSLYYNSQAGECSEVGGNLQTLSKRFPLIKQIMAASPPLFPVAQLKVTGTVKQDRAYSVKFLASSPNGADLQLYLYNPETQEKAEFNTGNPIKVSGGSAWQIYSANLDNLNHIVSNNEVLVVSASNDFYLDNFLLTEITDRFYLIKSSSQIPPVCYYDDFDVYQGTDYNLGCSAYVDKSGINHNLHTFSSICDKSSIGCEQVISTNNYASYKEDIWGDTNKNKKCDTNEPDCVKVEADTALYIVYDQAKTCNPADLGCSLLGQAKISNGITAWSDVFKKNNPNFYNSPNSILCDSSGLGCEEWKNADNGGLSYFRDPGDNVCIYNSAQRGWYKNTASGRTSCDYSYFKTIGYGGVGNRIPVPTKEVGLCDVKFSGCREYIDPVSKFNPDLVIASTTNVMVQPNKLYVASSASSSETTLTFPNDVVPLLIDNTFGISTKKIIVGGTTKNLIFNSLNNISASKALTATVEVRELAVEYQLSGTVDKKSCNGLVNFNNGCVLFNERSIAGADGYNKLAGFYDPYVSTDKSGLVKCNSNQPGSCVANQLIKVRPDRVCSGWLDCSTYAKDENGNEICYSLRQCNSLDENYECNNFVPPILGQQNQQKSENATGYFFLNKYNIGGMKEVGLNSEAHFDFEEIIPSLSCVRVIDTNGKECSFSNIAKELIVREPEKAKVDYPISGKSYLRVPAAYNVSPQPAGSWINLSSDQDYYLSYLLNTQNSAGGAKIIIETRNAATSTVFTASSTNGWVRKINRFNSGNIGANNGSVQIRINLRSDGLSGAEGEAYFDDINIEPVLQVGDNQYVARECRLYPTSSSLSCKNQSKNVIKDGLEGYCLEHDKANPSVCVTWFPADRVSSSVLGSQSLGYSGPTGLSYCTNVNANIKFAKKIVTKLVYNTQDKDNSYYIDGIGSNILCEQDTNSGIYNPNCINVGGAGGAVSINRDWCGEMAASYAQTYCGDQVNYRAIHVNSKQSFNNEFIYCVPRDKTNSNPLNPNFLFGVGSLTTAVASLPYATSLDTAVAQTNCAEIKFFKEAWVQADGFGTNGTLFTTHPVIRCDDEAEGKCEEINEATNANPPIRIYDMNHPAVDEQGLQYLAADASNRDKVFNFTCNNFAQVVSGSGINKAWVVRTTADPRWATTTPYFFDAIATPGNLKLYGRQRNGVPFGAAVFPEDFDILNSGPVYLQNQYYLKDKQSVLGGRPYDCTGNACMNIGYCSDNPNVMCVFLPKDYHVVGDNIPTFSLGNNDGDYVNKKTCSDGGFGVCRPLWNSTNFVGSDVLSSIFLQSYGSFKFDSGTYAPDSVSWNKSGSPQFNRPEFNPKIISSPKLKLNGVDKEMIVDRSGVYSLEFNTLVDPEHQPLKMVYIEWGDGNKQAVTGQDHRPDAANPHVIYHYYDGNYGNLGTKIKLKIWDNWDNTSN